jgi:hypothetical protein
MEKLGQKVAAKDVEALSQARVFAPRSMPLPGTEEMLRRMLGPLMAGTPDYDMLSPGLATAVREQLPMTNGIFAGAGAIKSVTFVGPGAQGGDTFDVEFEKGVFRWSLLLSADGKKIEGLRFAPAPPRN